MEELRVSFSKIGLILTLFVFFILLVVKFLTNYYSVVEIFFLFFAFGTFFMEVVFFEKLKKYLLQMQIFSYVILLLLIFVGYVSLKSIAILLWLYPIILSAFFIMPKSYALIVPILSLYGLAYIFYFHIVSFYDMVNLLISVVIFSYFSFKLSSLIEEYEGRIKEQNNTLKELANKDYLTGAYNRRAFFELVNKIKVPSAIIMFDLDYFKKINDTYGHDVGDEVLKFFSSLVKTHIRESDVFARIGGEEFVLVLAGSDLEAGRRVAEKIRKLVEKSQINGVKFTISAGVSLYEGDIQKALKEADEALYEAKKKRNEVRVYSLI